MSSWNCFSAWKQSLPPKFSCHKSPPRAALPSPATTPGHCHALSHRPSLLLRPHSSLQIASCFPISASPLLPLPTKLGAQTPSPALLWVTEDWAPCECRMHLLISFCFSLVDLLSSDQFTGPGWRTQQGGRKIIYFLPLQHFDTWLYIYVYLSLSALKSYFLKIW